MTRTAIIIGAGPAGLTAALELLERTDIVPVVLEASDMVGGISRTVNHHGNRIDIGGHRFFSRSDEVMAWWNRILPFQDSPDQARCVADPTAADPATAGQVMLIRSRKSRIYYGRKFYNYPVTLEWQTIRNLGFRRMVRIGVSYLWARLRPRPERSLEDFYINRFGRELYATFFRDYTEKVWEVPCSQIAPDWGAQRVRELSVSATLIHAVKQLGKRLLPGKRTDDVRQKDTAVSLIEYFLYPPHGPGQMWETVGALVRAKGGQIQLGQRVTGILAEPGRVVGVRVDDGSATRTVEADFVFSTMPVKDLVAGLSGVAVPPSVRQIAAGLPYRDFITVGLLLAKLEIPGEPAPLLDNWIYIQEPDITMGRMQIFNNWSPAMVADPSTVWVGLEYFANEGDALWSLSDQDMTAFAIGEVATMGLADPADVLDSVVIHMAKTYPAYFGSYERFDEVRGFLDGFDNLFLIGRNGQHRYNNQDHSMLTAIRAVDNIAAGRRDKANIWQVNADQSYHEERAA